MMAKLLFKFTLVVAAIGSMTGCTAVHDQARATIDQSMAVTPSLIEAKRQQSLANVQRSEGLYLSDSEVKAAKRKLPALFDQYFEIEPGFSTLSQLAESVTAATKIPVRIIEDSSSQQASPSQSPSSSSSAATSGATSGATSAPPMPPMPAGATTFPPSLGSQRAATSVTDLSVSKLSIKPYAGSLKGFLDMLASKAGMSWRYENNQIVYFVTETRSFIVSSLPGVIDASMQVGSGASSAGGGTGSTAGGAVVTDTKQNSTSTMKIEPWANLEAAVRSMLTAKGRVIASPATSTLVVTDTPETLDAVGKYIAGENNRLGKRVDLYVKVYSVKVGKGENYGLNWNAVYAWLGRNTQISFGSGVSPSKLNGSLSFHIGGGPWAGTDAVFNALSTQGDVSEMTSAHLSPHNNRPAPIFVGKKVFYLAKATTTISDKGNQTALEPGTVDTGFNLNILPSIIEKNRISLRYAMDINNLVSLKDVVAPDNSQKIQVPELARRSMMFDTVVRNGETLVIAGLEQDVSDATREGFGSPNAWLMGGRSAANASRDVIVVAISTYLN